MSEASDRTIPATSRRREAARQQGAMPMSALLAWVAMVVVVLLLLPGWAIMTVPAAACMLRQSLREAILQPPGSSSDLSELVPAALLLPTMGLVLVSAAVGLLVRFMLDGSSWRLSRALPEFQRIDPFAGLKRMISISTGRMLLGNAVSLGILVVAAALVAKPLVSLCAGSGEADNPAAFFLKPQQSLLQLTAVAAMVAICQWSLSRRRFEQRIRMTPQEFADESRSLEADPKVRILREKQFRTQISSLSQRISRPEPQEGV